VRKETKKRKLVMFTSLPHVGGHSTLTLGLCRLFSAWFSEIEVWVKVMPEHGHSVDVQKALEQQGFRVVLISNEKGHIKPLAVARAVLRSWLRPPEVFFALAMRNLSLVLRLLMFGSRGVYFHITHDLNQRTSRWLGFVEKIFSKLVFICPATYKEFASQLGKTAWAPQSSEFPDLQAEAVLRIKRERQVTEPNRLSFGLLGRLTREKGAQAVLNYIRNCDQPCDFHIAGTGPFASEFEGLANQKSEVGPRVYFHGSYSPAKRGEFLRDFFGGIDWLIVPSLDEWETLSMVTLEALQHGTPILCSNAGGLRSFGMQELGPAPKDVIRLFHPVDLSAEISRALSGSAYDAASRFGECREHYATHFSDAKVVGRWKALVG
jgi:glycosyltransferase involved in cell wall biosynthesis